MQAWSGGEMQWAAQVHKLGAILASCTALHSINDRTVNMKWMRTLVREWSPQALAVLNISRFALEFADLFKIPAQGLPYALD